MQAAASGILFFFFAFGLAILLYLLIVFLFRILFHEKKKYFPECCAPVSIIIACYNEEHYIRSKIESFIDPDEWIEGSELIIVSGGSTDRTNGILAEYSNNKNIKLIFLEHRVTKIIGVNLAVAHSKHDILVFSDCRQRMKKGSVRRLIAPLGNPEIGTVSCTLKDDRENDKMSFIRNMMNWIAFNESSSRSSLNLFGALYAQCKSVYRTIPDDILFDDLFVTVSTMIQRKKLIQVKEAVIHDIRFEHYYKKERIERLARGLLIFLFLHKKLFFQLPVGLFFRFTAYKYLKLALPFILCIMLFCALVLAVSSFHLALFLIAFGFILILMAIPKTRNALILFTRVQFYFMTATLKFLFLNERSIAWSKLKASSAE